LLLGFSALSHAAAPPPSPVTGAITKALPLLVKGGRGHMDKRNCFGCHNQGAPILALTTARSRGFNVRREDVHDQLEFIDDFLSLKREEYRKGLSLGGKADTAGYALATLEWGGWKPNVTTETIVEFLLHYQADLSHWAPLNHRPPSQGSHFTTTYWGVRALRVWGTGKQKERIARRLEAVRGWLEEAPAFDTEDRVFRLRALQEVGVKGKMLDDAVQDLVRTQHDDGGWGQLDELRSDAYATATALVALHQSRGRATNDKVYQRGVAWLLKNQRADGTWLVHTRSRPLQKYFESGFPHGKHQFISMAATGWAVTALALTIPEPTPTALGKR
jgi:N-acyl-D-amino-acid deacylase